GSNTSGLRLLDSHAGESRLRRGQSQQPDSAAQVPASQRRRGRDNALALSAPVARLDELRQDFAGAGEDSSLPRRERKNDCDRAWQEAVRKGSGSIPAEYEKDAFERRVRPYRR